jgi:methylated-DNA-[protein]-cysteine S-methyltransferase
MPAVQEVHMYAPDTTTIATPIGAVTIQGADDVVHSIHLTGAGELRAGQAAAVREAAAQLTAYFAGRLRAFDLPLAAAASPRGAVLREAIVAIGYGDTASYGAIARQIGSSARALGQACARNPFPLVVPCHRVLQAGGVLGPYSAGEGPVTKRWLLAFEGAAASV